MDSLLLSAIAGFSTAILGAVVSLLSKRKAEEEKKLRAQAGDLADAISARAEEAKAKALQALAEKLPASTNLDDFVRALSQISEQGSIRQVFNIRQEVKEGTKASQEWSIVENLVDGYHRQALDQARVQFWFSVAAATTGFIWIIYAGNSVDIEKWSSSFKTFPGIVIEVVAFLFFKQAEATRQRATALYDRLRTDNQHTQAISLVDSIDDINVRSAVKAQLSLHMAGLTPQPIDLTAFLSSKGKDSLTTG